MLSSTQVSTDIILEVCSHAWASLFPGSTLTSRSQGPWAAHMSSKLERNVASIWKEKIVQSNGLHSSILLTHIVKHGYISRNIISRKNISNHFWPVKYRIHLPLFFSPKIHKFWLCGIIISIHAYFKLANDCTSGADPTLGHWGSVKPPNFWGGTNKLLLALRLRLWN